MQMRSSGPKKGGLGVIRGKKSPLRFWFIFTGLARDRANWQGAEQFGKDMSVWWGHPMFLFGSRGSGLVWWSRQYFHSAAGAAV